MRAITNVQQRVLVTVYGLIQATTTMPLDSAAIKNLSQINPSCGAVGNIASSTILGVTAVKVERSDAKVKEVFWRAPSLGCISLSINRFRKTGSGQEVLISQREVTSITLGEPDVSLFTVPAFYQEEASSAVIKHLFEPYPTAKMPDQPDADSNYHASRIAAGLEK